MTQEQLFAKYELDGIADPFADLDAIITQKEQQIVHLSSYKALYDAMIGRVSEVLQSGDPAQYEALALEFLTPEAEKQAQAIDAEIAALQAKRDALPV